MKIKRFFALCVAVLLATGTYADLKLTAHYRDKSGKDIAATGDFSAEAPLHVRFESNPASLPTTAQIDWTIKNSKTGSNISRSNQEDIEFDITDAGVTTVTVLVSDGNTVLESASIRITISDSHLEMPNAFSPNGDGINDTYQAKSNHKSIIEFHAYIFNRYGQKLYDWTDINGGWDGTSHGHDVKDGVYFVYVKAKGADGVEYNIRKDVNLLRKFNNTENSNGK